MNDDSFDRSDLDDYPVRKKPHRPMNDPKPIFLSSTYNRHRTPNRPNINESNLKDKQIRRNMRRKCKKLAPDQRRNCTLAVQRSWKSTVSPAIAINQNTSRSFHEKELNEAKTMQGLAQPYQNFQYINAMLASSSGQNVMDNRRTSDESERALEQQILQRTIRSHQRRNTSGAMSPLQRAEQSSTTTTTTNGKYANSTARSEITHLNPELCYKLNALSHSQQKLCASNTQIMPAISRGARAAIQVTNCKINVLCDSCIFA